MKCRFLETFFKEHIIKKKGNSIKTVDVNTKINELVLDKNIRYNKFEVSKFMKDKGVVRKKGSNHTYYVDIEIV